MKKKIQNFFRQNSEIGIKPKLLAKRLKINDLQDYSQLKKILHELVQENFLVRKGKRYQFNFNTSGKITGTLQIIPERSFGFVIPRNGNLKDIYISELNLGTAFDSDTVEVTLLAKRKGKNLEGQISKVIKRARLEIVGTLKKTNSFYFVHPDESRMHRDIYISKDDLAGAKNGDKVVVGNLQWNSPLLNPEGKIIEVLGISGSYDTEITALAREFNFKYKFSAAVIKETKIISENIPSDEINNRLDYRDKITFTIDPETAKDFDDAVSVEKLDSGNFKVGIHIADVSHYVKPGTKIYEEALNRGTSVYLVGKVIPMLPEKLSNNICSLVPGKNRLTFSVLAELTPHGKLVSYNISKSIINSKKRFSYSDVQKIIDKGNGEFYEQLSVLNNIAKNLRINRQKKGSINFITPEVEFELDKNGVPVKIKLKQILESNNLIEEFMLLANKIVARHINKKSSKNKTDFIYRIHDEPDEEKMTELASFVQSLGYSFNPKAQNKPKQFQSLIEQVKGTAEEALINEITIRSMSKAIYSTDNIGHYGLSFPYYTHFTSPIRRFPDLVIHLLIFDYLKNRKNKTLDRDELVEICKHSSEQERKALDAERLSIKLKQIEYLRNKIGEEFEGIISGVTSFGLFVELSDILAEGLVKMRDMEDDFYIYDEKKYALLGKHTKKSFRLGDKIRVRLIRIDEEKRGIDFLLLDN